MSVSIVYDQRERPVARTGSRVMLRPCRRTPPCFATILTRTATIVSFHPPNQALVAVAVIVIFYRHLFVPSEAPRANAAVGYVLRYQAGPDAMRSYAERAKAIEEAASAPPEATDSAGSTTVAAGGPLMFVGEKGRSAPKRLAIRTRFCDDFFEDCTGPRGIKQASFGGHHLAPCHALLCGQTS